MLQHQNGAKFLVGGAPWTLAEMYGRYAALCFPEGLDRIPPEAWILDVGAHRGFFATAIIQHCPGARVIAVEPDPVAMAALQANIALNGFEGRADTIEAGLGECDGYGYLLRSNQGSWSNHMTADPCHGDVVRVRSVRLSSILRDRRPHVVKGNAEGGEFHLLPQLFQLAVHPAIIILMAHPEARPVNLERRGRARRMRIERIEWTLVKRSTIRISSAVQPTSSFNSKSRFSRSTVQIAASTLVRRRLPSHTSTGAPSGAALSTR